MSNARISSPARRACGIGALALALVFFTEGLGAIEEPFPQTPENPSFGCGVNSLYAYCVLEGLTVSRPQVAQLCGEPGRPRSMLDLYNASIEIGLSPVGQRCTINDLFQVDCPFIAHLRRSHFTLVTRVADGKVEMLDYPGAEERISIDEFSEMWSGNILTLAPGEELTFPRGAAGAYGPEALVAKPVFDFGATRQNQLVDGTFELINAGDEPLEILDHDLSCKCTRAVLSSTRIASGSSSTINVTLDTGERVGRISEQVELTTNDPIRPSVKLRITGDIVMGIGWSPKRIEFGRFFRSNVPVRTVRVLGDSSEEFQVTDCRSLGSQLQCQCRAVVHRLASGVELRGFAVEIAPRKDLPTQKFNDRVLISTTNPDFHTIEIPVRGESIDVPEVTPGAVFFGVVKTGTEVCRTVVLKEHGGIDFRILDQEVLPEGISVQKNEAHSSAQSFVLRFKSEKAGLHEGVVGLSTGSVGDPEIEIPYLAYAMDTTD